MASTARRCLFFAELIAAIIVLGLSAYLLAKAPGFDTYEYSYAYSYVYTSDLRLIVSRYLIGIGSWSIVFSIVWFFSGFSRHSIDVAVKSRRVIILLLTMLECGYWFGGVGAAAWEAYDYKNILSTVEWSVLLAATGVSGVMALFTFTNFILACRDLNAKRKAGRAAAQASKADLEGRAAQTSAFY